MNDSDVVIRVEGLGKKYALHHETSERYTSLRDVVARQARAAGRLLNPFTLAGQLRKAHREAAAERAESEEEFWALKDVSFEIRRGERVGIIGRNGAGKSTLLKILSRITEPTTGRVEIRGRVASLLEVGTGFHPELTGQENIYLNGAILGMTRREIRSKFDEIVDFAEVEKFLDTPVKRYSSGMYVRLAFAVAAHLEPEILVVDEVLAVGDVEFQKKCLNKMGTVSDEGRTILFVSHNMPAINKLCSIGILLGSGSIRVVGTAHEVVSAYISSTGISGPSVRFPRRNSATIQYIAACIKKSSGEIASIIPDREPFIIELEVEAFQLLNNIYFGLILAKDDVNVVFADSRDNDEAALQAITPGIHRFKLQIPGMFSPGRYSVNLGIADSLTKESLDSIENVLSFEILQIRGARLDRRPGLVNLNVAWEHERASDQNESPR